MNGCGKMKTGMVIVHYNDYNSITNLLNIIRDYKTIDKIVIVDNNSKEEVKKELKKLTSSKIELIEEKENKGFAYAINVGCKKLIKELGKCNLIISNADVIIDKEEDISKLTSYLKGDIGVVSPVILEKNKLNRGWKNPSPFLDAMMNNVYIHNPIRKKFIFYKDEYYDGETTEVEVVSGCFFLINSDTLKEINFLDENTFLYYEENILAKKIENINKKLIVCNDILIIHNHAVSIDKNLKKLKKLKIQKKSQYYFQKEYNHANILERFFLKLTVYVNRVILAIMYFFKDLFKK